MKRTVIRVMAGIMALILCLCGGFSAAAKTTSELKKERAQLEQKLEAANKKVKDLEAKASDTKTLLEALSEKMNLAQEKLEDLTIESNKLDRSIQDLAKQIAEQQKQFDQNYEDFSHRLRALQISGDVSQLEILLTAEDFSSFLTRMEMVRGVSRQDKKALDSLMKSMEKIKKNKASLETQKKQLEKDKKALQKSKAEYEKDAATCETKLKQLEKEEGAAKEQAQHTEEDLEENEALIRSKMSSGPISGGSSQVTGNFIVPVQGSCYVSSEFKWRWGRQHKGIDISGANFMGRPILAADAGRVIVSMFGVSGSGFGGYGNVVLIDHGNGLATLYAHNSALLVSEGEWVKQGQQIAKAGNTGNSKGAHLHFEVRVNGTAVNPRNYLSI